MRALVTGANGFIGSHLVEELLAQGFAPCCCVRRRSDLAFLDAKRVELFTCDLAEDLIPEARLRDAGVVFHLAGRIRAPNALAYQRANVEASLRLYERYAKVAPAGARFVFCSSVAAAGPSRIGQVLSEADAPRPISVYGQSKLDAESGLAALSGSGPPVSILRPTAVYGPRDRALLRLFKLAARGFTFCVGSPERVFTMIHVRDLARAMIAAGSHAGGVGTFFLTDGGLHSWREIAAAFAAAAKRPSRPLTLPGVLLRAAAELSLIHACFTRRPPLLSRKNARDLDAQGWACAIAAARAGFGFEPQVSLNEGLTETYRWYREAGWL